MWQDASAGRVLVQQNDLQVVLAYQQASPAPGFWRRVVTCALCVLPFVALTPALLMYVVAWATLGYRPQVSLDDPKDLPLEPFYTMTPLACLLWPVSLIVTPMWLIAAQRSSPRRAWIWGMWCTLMVLPFVFDYLTDFASWYAD
jgi:hypothetical protein